MSDKKLLELAAKAAGYEFCWMCRGANNPNGTPNVPFANGYEWNPLTDDGDALRLAVKLNLLILPYSGDKAVRVTRLNQPDTIVSWGTPPDMYAATRRAIVRAAAEIGKGME